MIKKVMAILVICSMMAGCADAIPDPNEVYNEEEAVRKIKEKEFNIQNFLDNNFKFI